MRAALRVFEDYLDPKAFQPYLKVLRETGRTLGLVRDLDVFLIKTQSYIDSLPEETKGSLVSLLDAWGREREKDRARMLDFLDSGRYLRFRDGFEEFLRTPGAGEVPRVSAEGEPLPSRVKDVLPAVVYGRLAHVRAFDEWIHVDDVPLIRFHQLRIASKGLRYTLEFFQEVLGSDSKVVIDKTKLLQDHLGDMQDAIVTCDWLLGFLTTGSWGPPRAGRLIPRGMAAGSPGVAVYLAAKETEIQMLRATFPPVWEKIRGREFSAPLAGLVAVL
jgi:CHAD domain-containing protein